MTPETTHAQMQELVELQRELFVAHIKTLAAVRGCSVEEAAAVVADAVAAEAMAQPPVQEVLS